MDNYIPSIAVCLGKIYETQQERIIRTIEKFAKINNLRPVIFTSVTDLYNQDNNDFGEKSVFSLIPYNKFKALIIFPESLKDEVIVNQIIDGCNKAKIPCITVGKKCDNCYNLIYDFYSAFKEIVEHVIIEHKCKKLAMIAGMKNNPFSDERIECFKKTLLDQNLPFYPEWLEYGDFWEDPARRACIKIIDSRNELPDAIICANDSMATVVCDELMSRGYKIPQDIIVTGFDGYEAGKYFYPRISTAYCDEEETGKMIFDIVIKFINGAKIEPSDIIINYNAFFSESCGCQQAELLNKNKYVLSLSDKLANYAHNQNYVNDMYLTLTDDKLIDEIPITIKKFILEVGYKASAMVLNSYFYENSSEINAKELPEGHDRVVAFQQFGDKYIDKVETFNVTKGLASIDSINSYGDITIILPIHAQQKVFGSLIVACKMKKMNFRFLVDLVLCINNSFESIYNQTRLVKVNKQLNNLYNRDPLTKLYNRRGFYQSYYKYADSKKDNQYIHVFSIDLNNLKKINDNFGHDEGDYAIRQMAKVLLEIANDYEDAIYARFGGDEFILAIVDNNSQQEINGIISNKLSEKLVELNKEIKKDYPITAAIGNSFSELNPDTDIDNLLKIADKDMYVNKETYKKSIIRDSKRPNDRENLY